MRQVVLKKDRVEVLRLKRAWFTMAWRLVLPGSDLDMVQPWFQGRGGRKEALAFATSQGWTVVGEEA